MRSNRNCTCCKVFVQQQQVVFCFCFKLSLLLLILLEEREQIQASSLGWWFASIFLRLYTKNHKLLPRAELSFIIDTFIYTCIR